MSAKPTAGRKTWHASTYEGGWDCVRDESGREICRLVHNEPANAVLLAAAPDLLEALKNLVEPCECYGRAHGSHGRYCEIARAAIAKAGGR